MGAASVFNVVSGLVQIKAAAVLLGPASRLTELAPLNWKLMP